MGFSVVPEALAGYATMMDELSHPTYEVVWTIGDDIDVELDGVLGAVLYPSMHTVAGKLSRMAVDRATTGESVRMNLNAAAWQYWNDDHGNAKKFDQAGDEQTEPMPGAVSYPVQYPKLHVPDSELKGPDQIAEDVSGLAGAIDAICELAAESPISSLLTELLSDWRVLDRAGIALQQTGDRLDHVRDDVSGHLGKLLGQWEGDAADAFRDYMTRHANAVEDQAAVHRLLGECYRLTAEAIQAVAEKAAAEVTKRINEFLGDAWWKFLLKMGLRAVPVLGAVYTVEEAAAMLVGIKDALERARTLLDDFLQALREKAINSVVEFLEGKGEAAAKGAEFVRRSQEFYGKVERIAGRAEDVAAKTKEFVEQAAHTKELAADLAQLTVKTPDGLDQAPAGDYSAGGTKQERSRDTR